ncbi:MAG: hypothetical protein IPN69_04690 [Acidobacteria bacterium]|nr:hypothetical protein [Acidobacteriota bacterium]MBK8810011.1 hypothetical protein [Acidobacteriota bacterium]
MDFAFQAIGIEVPNESAFNELAVDVGRRGEATLLQRTDGILHGRCLKLGKGLEVWTLLYEPRPGEVVYADCRPAFRARRTHSISPWILSEVAEEGAAIVHGFIEDTETEVLFELQNLTEVGTGVLDASILNVGLCGLAYRAEVFEEPCEPSWINCDELVLNVVEQENEWSLSGRIRALESIRNPHSGSDLFWFYVEVGDLFLEVLVNQTALTGTRISVGSYIRADVWLQGHIVLQGKPRGFEGIDRAVRSADHWSALKRPN